MTKDPLKNAINIIIEDLGHLSKNVARGYGAMQPTVRTSKPSLGDSEYQDEGYVKEITPVKVSRAFLKAKAEDQINESDIDKKIMLRIIENIISEIVTGTDSSGSSAVAGRESIESGEDSVGYEKGEGKCASVPNLCTIKGDKQYVGDSRIGVSAPGFWKKFRRGLQRHVNREYPELGLKVADLGVSRDLDASVNPSSGDRVSGSKHGAGMANDLYLHTKKYGEYTSYKKDNKVLAKDKKLVSAIRSYVATQPGIKWGGEFGGNGPTPGSRGELEFHHFEKEGSKIPKEFSKYDDDLKKIGMSASQLTNTSGLAKLYKKLAQ